MIPKKNGGERPLGVPTIRDRVVQMSASIVLNAIFEADFRGCSFGYRPKKNPTQALERIRITANKGYNYVVDADIKSYFTSIDHEMLMKLVERRISDRRVIKLIRQWLKSGVMVEGHYEDTLEGTPQGSGISPLLSNIVLNELDTIWEEENGSWGKLTRFCDDFVIQCLSRKQAIIIKKKLEIILNQLKLELHPEKTRIVNLSYGKEGFEFLGNYLKKMPSYRFSGKYFLNRWPSSKSQQSIKEKVRKILSRKRFGIDSIISLVPELNRTLKGWGNYFKYGNVNKIFLKVDRYVHYRLSLFENKRRNRPHPHWQREFTYKWYQCIGVHQLCGTTEYPNPSLVLAKANA
jgi:group II intron reverse transcriptase/maturase